MKYKLKKWYPSLPDNWREEEDIVVKDYESKRHDDKCYIVQGKGLLVSKHEIENNPEFWEPVEEKKYEILKMKLYSGDICTFKGQKCVRRTVHTEAVGSTIPLNNLLEAGIHEIYSVRRMSDNHIFTVGDKITHKLKSLTTKIERFFFKLDNLYVEGDNGRFRLHFSNVKHIEQPLFTTQDGVDIYEGDIYYVPQKDNDGTLDGTIVRFKATGSKNYINKSVNRFSTREKAEEYIDRHKPQYSKADIKRVANKLDNHYKKVNSTIGELLLREFLID